MWSVYIINLSGVPNAQDVTEEEAAQIAAQQQAEKAADEREQIEIALGGIADSEEALRNGIAFTENLTDAEKEHLTAELDKLVAQTRSLKSELAQDAA